MRRSSLLSRGCASLLAVLLGAQTAAAQVRFAADARAAAGSSVAAVPAALSAGERSQAGVGAGTLAASLIAAPVIPLGSAAAPLAAPAAFAGRATEPLAAAAPGVAAPAPLPVSAAAASVAAVSAAAPAASAEPGETTAADPTSAASKPTASAPVSAPATAAEETAARSARAMEIARRVAAELTQAATRKGEPAVLSGRADAAQGRLGAGSPEGKAERPVARSAALSDGPAKSTLWNWKIFTAFGIPVYIHASFPLIVVLFVHGFLRQLPWMQSLAMPLLVYGPLLAHEFGHALTGQRFGVETEKIVMHLLGGTAAIKNNPRRASHEFWITIMGPLVNVAAAALLLPAASLFHGPWHTALLDAGAINVFIAAFNLLVPAYPMDGGRLLHALIWKIVGHEGKATRIAAAISMVLAAIAAGLSLYFGLPMYTLMALAIGFAAFSAYRQNSP